MSRSCAAPAIVNYSSTSYQPDDFDTEVAETYGAVYNDAGFDFRGTKYLYDSNNKQISPTQLVLGRPVPWTATKNRSIS